MPVLRSKVLLSEIGWIVLDLSTDREKDGIYMSFYGVRLKFSTSTFDW